MQEAGAEQNSKVGGDIRAGQREERGQLTAVVGDGLILTEVQAHSWKDVDERIQKSHAPGAPH